MILVICVISSLHTRWHQTTAETEQAPVACTNFRFVRHAHRARGSTARGGMAESRARQRPHRRTLGISILRGSTMSSCDPAVRSSFPLRLSRWRICSKKHFVVGNFRSRVSCHAAKGVDHWSPTSPPPSIASKISFNMLATSPSEHEYSSITRDCLVARWRRRGNRGVGAIAASGQSRRRGNVVGCNSRTSESDHSSALDKGSCRKIAITPKSR
jgi:hypothetical protein